MFAFPRKKRFLSEVMQGLKGDTWWSSDEVGHNQEAKRESKVFNPNSIFPTPKPERLIERILTLATDPGDLVLDSFLGSGAAAAVAHKMGRRYIGIELWEHCYTHVLPRLRAVVDGESGGISKAQGWQGGGGFDFFEMPDSLVNTDAFGNPIISPDYNAEMLAAAMALHKGYTYAPDSGCPTIQGFRGTGSYIYTTTVFVTPELVAN